jgi:hypothetical protein
VIIQPHFVGSCVKVYNRWNYSLHLKKKIIIGTSYTCVRLAGSESTLPLHRSGILLTKWQFSKLRVWRTTASLPPSQHYPWKHNQHCLNILEETLDLDYSLIICFSLWSDKVMIVWHCWVSTMWFYFSRPLNCCAL